MNNCTAAPGASTTPGSVTENMDDIPSEKNVETLQVHVYYNVCLSITCMCVQYYKLETIIVVSDVIAYCPSSTTVKFYAKFVFKLFKREIGASFLETGQRVSVVVLELSSFLNTF